MTASTPASGSTPLERDARLVNAREHRIAPGEIAIGVIVGRTSEFFDFFVYALASVLVFPAVVFPYVDRLTGTIYSFALFALAFVARPFGTLLFTAIDHHHGRGVKLTAALFLLGTEMDFERTALRTGFTFSNPNQSSACGCGESVELKPADLKALAEARTVA